MPRFSWILRDPLCPSLKLESWSSLVSTSSLSYEPSLVPVDPVVWECPTPSESPLSLRWTKRLRPGSLMLRVSTLPKRSSKRLWISSRNLNATMEVVPRFLVVPSSLVLQVRVRPSSLEPLLVSPMSPSSSVLPPTSLRCS